ncbi:hypothetical protein F511_38605 [Dorcoceras hygrometricum]|uniref:Uncharacterized protein n=1 Tax=Dorcoceras hygrometricum TaxID=472368 RepID=A0A2Z7CDG1_9LAMI|nr:hypothetical protein F511_38605 [Dorcoceras hygrometricum]
MHFTADDLPLDEETNVCITLPTYFTEDFAQLRATVTNILRKEIQDQKAALSTELDALRKEVHDQKAAMLEFRAESQEHYSTLRDQLAEIIAYINRGRDDKKGEMSSSRGRQPPPDD